MATKALRSLRWRLVLAAVLVSALAIGVGGLAIYLDVAVRLYAEFDDDLAQRAIALTGLFETDDDEIEAEWLERGSLPAGHREGADFLTIVDRRADRLLYATPSDAGRVILPVLGGSLENPVFRSVTLSDGLGVRAVGLEWSTQERGDDDDNDDDAGSSGQARSNHSKPRVSLVLAKVDTVAVTLSDFRRRFLLVWVLCLILSVALAGALVRQGLAPLRSLQRRIHSLDESARGQQLDNSDMTSELIPIVTSLNQTLGRLDAALAREKAITSNVAHEMRTPVAGMLSTLEVALSRERSQDEYREACRASFDIARKLHWLVSNLLSLCRLEAGSARFQPREWEIEVLLTEWWEPFESMAASKSASVHWYLAQGVRLRADRDFLGVAVRNLFENAVEYVDEGGVIEIETTPNGRIRFANACDRLSSDVAERAVESHWRAGPDPERKHTGLGLGLSRKILESMDGQLVVRVTGGNWFEVELSLPTASNHPDMDSDEEKRFES